MTGFTVLGVRPLAKMPRRFEVTCETRPARENERADESGQVHVASVEGPAATVKCTEPSRREALSFAIGTYRDLEQLARERRKSES
jgi:hypothetical protein